MPDTRPRITAIMLASSLMVAGLLAGCSSQSFSIPLTSAKAALKELRVNALLNANSNTATALDVVIVYDKTALPLLPKTGPEWFARKAELLTELTGRIKLVSIQAPPGIAMTVPLPAREGMLQALAYAAYEKQPVANLSAYRCALILIGSDSIKTSECR
jgi:type VI secretion system protein